MKKRVLMGLGLLACFSLLAHAQTWDPVTRLTYTTRNSVEEDVAAYGPNVHVVWREYSYTPSYFSDIFFKKSTDTGATWSPPLRLTWLGGLVSMSWPAIAANSSAVHIAYGQNFNLIYRKSTDNGASWSRTQLTWGIWADTVALAVNGNSIHLVFRAMIMPPTYFGLYYKRSTDNGETWSPLVKLGDIGLSAAPSLAVSGTNVHVAYLNDALHWGHNDLYYRRSTDNGVTWNAPLQLATLRNVQLREAADIPRSVFQPSVTASGTDVHLFYRSQPTYFETHALYYKSSADNGATWAAERRLTWDGNCRGLMPKASAAAGDNVYVTYLFYGPPSYADEIYFKKSTDAGVTWSGPARLTYLGDVYYGPSMIYSPGTGYFHLVFRFQVDTDTYFTEIYYKRGH